MNKLGVTAKRVLAISQQNKKLALAAEQIMENEERLRVGLSLVNVCVFHQDKDLRYTWVYQPQILKEIDAIIGKTDYDLFPGRNST